MSTTPNPAQVAFRVQAARINAKLDASPETPANRAKRRANGYRGPLTRADLAEMAKKGHFPRNGRS